MGAQGSTFQIGYADFFRKNEMFMAMLWIEVQDIYLWRLHWTP